MVWGLRTVPWWTVVLVENVNVGILVGFYCQLDPKLSATWEDRTSTEEQPSSGTSLGHFLD